MTPEEEATCRDACRQLLARYAIAVDAGDAVAMTALFAQDGVLVRGDVVLRGRNQLPRIFEGRAPGTVMRQLLSTQSIEIAPDGASATGLTYYLLFSASGDKTPLAMPTPFSLGDWHSAMVLTPKGWKFARQEIRRQFTRRNPE